MMKNVVLGLVCLAVLLPPAVADACGYSDPVPSDDWHPEGAYEEFVAGKPGVIQRTWSARYLAYAWRSMMGIPTPGDAQRQVVADWRSLEVMQDEAAELASNQWATIRNEVAPFPGAGNREIWGTQAFASYSRIHADAFFKAGATARALAVEWKERPELLVEWVHNQDNVFSDCKPLAATLPELAVELTPREQTRRRFERDYQTAAAHFYCNRFEDAARAFQAIADSADSPYRALAAYLVARTRVRQVLLTMPDDYAGARKMEGALEEGFLQADAAIQKVLDDPKLREVRGPTLRLQSLVRTRLSRETWSCELYSRVLQKGTGTGLGAHLIDLSSPGDDLAKECPGLPPAAAELAEWLQLMARSQRDDPKVPSQSFATAVARWKKTKHQPWLVLALLTARADSPGLPDLLTAAEKVPLGAPAGLTLAWRSVVLLGGRGEVEKARAKLQAIPREMVRTRPRAYYLLHDERLHLSRDWEEALRNVLHSNILDPSEASADGPPKASEPEPQMFGPWVSTLERQATTRSLRGWLSLPWMEPALRRQLSWTLFARAAVLEDDETLVAMAKQLAETEPKARAELLTLVEKPTVEERRFDARLLLMGLPAVSALLMPTGYPYATLAPQRALTQVDFSYNRNGWCPPPKSYAELPVAAPFPFLGPEERAAADAEYLALSEAGSSVVFFSRVALDWAKAHPEDPRSPVALYRAVHASRYACGQRRTPEAQEAFAWLHKHYGKTEWAKRAPRVY
jgi:hypothetical protein